MSDKFGRHSEKRISELHQRMRDSKLGLKGNSNIEIVYLKWWAIMPDDYSKHLEKRIKEMHERMAKSKLHRSKRGKMNHKSLN